MDKAVRRVAEKIRIPGFRPGKAPRHIVERTVGRSALIQEALDQMLPDLYDEVIEAEAIEAIGQPEIELKSLEPLVVHATVPVRPTIDLRDYRSLRAPRIETEIAPEQVEEALTALRRRFATLDPVDRAIEWGDTVRADVTVSVEGQEEPHVEEDAEFRVEQGTVISLPGFLDHLIGLERGGPYEISFQIPEEFEATELAGKTASYTVQLHEVKQEILPELNGDFVQSLDEDFETVDELRTHMDADLRMHAEADALARYHDEIIDLLLAGAEIDYPELLVEREIDRLLDQQSNHASHTAEELEQWLQQVGKTEEQVRDDLREAADLSVRRGLVISEFVEHEQVEVGDERVDEELEQLVEQMLGGIDDDEQRQTLRPMLDTEDSRASIRSRLLTQAALERLVEICSQPEEEQTAERPRGTRRRRGARGAQHDESGDASASTDVDTQETEEAAGSDPAQADTTDE